MVQFTSSFQLSSEQKSFFSPGNSESTSVLLLSHQSWERFWMLCETERDWGRVGVKSGGLVVRGAHLTPQSLQLLFQILHLLPGVSRGSLPGAATTSTSGAAAAALLFLSPCCLRVGRRRREAGQGPISRGVTGEQIGSSGRVDVDAWNHTSGVSLK